jgi:putative aminopeptidase FrvX
VSSEKIDGVIGKKSVHRTEKEGYEREQAFTAYCFY